METTSNVNTHQISELVYEKEGKLPINNLKHIVDIEVNNVKMILFASCYFMWLL